MATTMTTTHHSTRNWQPLSALRGRTQTLWTSFCQHCRESSINSKVPRPISGATAWDVAGPVLNHWNDTLFPIILEYRNKNSRDILRGHSWDGVVDCWMIGTSEGDATPYIVVTCGNEGILKRFVRLIKKDPTVQSSGFKLCGRRGNIRYRGSRPRGRQDISQRLVGTNLDHSVSSTTFDDTQSMFSPTKPAGRQYFEWLDPDPDPDAPDRVYCSYLGSLFDITFPTYTITEATTLVSTLRRQVASYLNELDARVRLVYKGRELRRNHYPLKYYGLKQHSEILVIVTDQSVDYDSDSDTDSGVHQSQHLSSSSSQYLLPTLYSLHERSGDMREHQEQTASSHDSTLDSSTQSGNEIHDQLYGSYPGYESSGSGKRRPSRCGTRVEISTATGRPGIATIGGTVLVDDRPMCLTVAHAFLESFLSWESAMNMRGFDTHAMTIFTDSDDEDDSVSEYSECNSSTERISTPLRNGVNNALLRQLTKQCYMASFSKQEISVGRSPAYNIGLSHDWALCEPVKGLNSDANFFTWATKELAVSRLAPEDPENEDVLLVGARPEPYLLHCSGACSLIGLPSTDRMVEALRLSPAAHLFVAPSDNHLTAGPGASGSWVVNPRNGDLYGIVVAEQYLLESGPPIWSETLMLRARDVFMDIECERGCKVTLPPGHQPVSNTMSHMGVSASMVTSPTKGKNIDNRSFRWPGTPSELGHGDSFKEKPTDYLRGLIPRQRQHYHPQLTSPKEVGKGGPATIRVTNLHDDMSEDDVHELFTRIGPLAAVRMLFNRAGVFKGTAYVTYYHGSEARMAIREFDGVNAKGQAIQLQLQTPSNQQSASA